MNKLTKYGLWLLLPAALVCVLLAIPAQGGQIAGRTGPDGSELQIDLPGSQQMKNVGGSDGAGLCVFTSIAHAARWQQVEVLEGLQQWMRSHPGGGWPQKVDQVIGQICQEKGVPKPAYLQSEGVDLDLLRAACKAGRMPGVTYSFSPTGRYNGQHIAHMVSLVHADDKWFVILDNNYPGESNYEWLTPAEFARTYAPGWCVILLDPGPPPPPHNKRLETRPEVIYGGILRGGRCSGGPCSSGSYASGCAGSCASGQCGPLLAPGCPGGFCPLAGPVSLPSVPLAIGETYRWEEYADRDPALLKLVCGNHQVGVWIKGKREYRPRIGDDFGPPCLPPIAPPGLAAASRCPSGCCAGECSCQGGKRCDDPHCPCLFPAREGFVPTKLPTGADFSKIKPGRHTLNGMPVCRETALQAIEGGSIPDDAGKQRLTVIGTVSDRARVVNDLKNAPELAAYRTALVVKSYDPSHWAVANAGFRTSGAPSIYLQEADGTVLHRQDGYAGAADLANALRKAQPDYDPNKDPDLRRTPAPPPTPPGPAPAPAPAPTPTADPVADALSAVPASTWLVAAAGGAGLLFLGRRKTK
jgi:hypothetical protein